MDHATRRASLRLLGTAAAVALVTLVGTSLLAHGGHHFHPALWRRLLLAAWLGAGYATVLTIGHRRRDRRALPLVTIRSARPDRAA